jgi:chemotaxis protein methyltransferase WspC
MTLPGSQPWSISPVERLLREWIGIDPGSVGTASIERACRRRMEARGLVDPQAYATLAGDDLTERDALVEEVVVAESWFFRDPQVFDFVARLAAALTTLPGRSPVRILSAPCASGEEPYSVAMALLDAHLAPEQFHIDAIDVSRAALERAARGRYSANAFRNADGAFRDRWFRTDGGHAVLSDIPRSCVRFAWANLLDPSFAAGRDPYDVIFCRNLLIYLDAPSRARVEAALNVLLRPDGVLVLGAAEPPILRGDWMPAGAASVFALRRGTPAARARPSAPPSSPSPRPQPGRAGPSDRAARPSQAYHGGDAVVGAGDLAALLHDAGTLANQGRIADALAACERARREYPCTPELFFLMGMLHQAAGDLDRAEGCLHKTLYLDAAHDEALLALALLADQRGERRLAETYRASAARVLARRERRP